MVSIFSSKLNDLHAWNNCVHVLPTFEYLCLTKFCNSGQVILFKGSRDWNNNLASSSNVRQNIWAFTPSTKWWAFIQSFEQSKCPSASSSGFPENSGLKFDQFMCKCCCCVAGSWFYCCCWFCCWFCPCLWLGTATLSPLSAIFTLNYNFLILVCHIIYFLFFLVSLLLSIPDVINLMLPSQISTHPWCLNLIAFLLKSLLVSFPSQLLTWFPNLRCQSSKTLWLGSLFLIFDILSSCLVTISS